VSSDTFNILFVCSGNSCRTPMAEGLMKSKISVRFKSAVQVRSAGTLGINGSPATDFAIMTAGKLGANISQHRSQGITEKLVKESDLIFAMASEHIDFLHKHYPEIRENVFLLRSFGRDPEAKMVEDIADPIGGPLEHYRQCGELINSELQRILPRLNQLIKEKLNIE